jgi:hypothetical protein
VQAREQEVGLSQQRPLPESGLLCALCLPFVRHLKEISAKIPFAKDAEILQIKISSAAGRSISEASPTGSGGKKIHIF